MGKRLTRIALGVLALILLGLLAWGYNYVSPTVPRASKEWSKGHIVGRTTISQPVAIEPDPRGGVIMVWSELGNRLKVIKLDENGGTALDYVVQVGAWNARDPQLELGENGRLHLLWRERGEPNATVRYLLIERDGTPVVGPRVLSDPDRWVADPPQLVSDAVGNLHAIWADEDGIHWMAMGTDGDVLRGPTLVALGGRSPSAQIDDVGRLHLAWQEDLDRNNRGIYYLAFDPSVGEIGEPEEMAQIFRRTGQFVEGPAFGMDGEIGYVLWTVQDRRDVVSEAQYAFFPLELPRQKRTQPLRFREGVNPSGVFPLPGQHTPLLVALSEETGTGLEVAVQIAVLIVAEDQTPEFETWGVASLLSGRRALLAPPAGAGATALQQDQRAGAAEHLVTASRLPSIRPAIAADAHSDLHLAWLEPGGFDQYRIVYASTAEAVQENYNAFSLWDVVNPIFSGVFRLSLIVLAAGPMMVLWILLPLGELLVFHIITGEEELRTRGAKIALAVAILLEIILTMALPPLQMDLAPLLRWGIPVVSILLAGLAAWRALRRAWDSPLFEVFFVFTGVNTLLQMALYFVL
ncbi:MAG: hypothetical protein PVI59_10490 [Anaerolineae bacterium]|jgi:hypothetical protein